MSSTESNRVYILNELVEGHTYVTDYGIYIEDPTPDVGFGYTIKTLDNLEPFGNPTMAVSRPYIDGIGEYIVLDGGRAMRPVSVPLTLFSCLWQ